MAEIMTPPIFGEDEDGETVTFTEKHTLADIARWIAQNKTDAEEVIRLLQEAVQTRYN